MSRTDPHWNPLCSAGRRSSGFVVSSAEVDPIPAFHVKATGGRFRRIKICSGDARTMPSHRPRATAQDCSTFILLGVLSTRLRRTIRCGGVFGRTSEDGVSVLVSSATPRMPHDRGRVRGMNIRVRLRHKFLHEFPAPIFSDTNRSGTSGQAIASRSGFGPLHARTGFMNHVSAIGCCHNPLQAHKNAMQIFFFVEF